jgi:hypothetical protein
MSDYFFIYTNTIMKLNTSIIAVSICTLVLTGCTSTTNTTPNTVSTAPTTQVVQTTSNGIEVLQITSNEIPYDGEHGGTRRQNDSITATITLDKNKIITAVALDQVAGEPKSRQYQSAFNDVIATEIVGKSINDVQIGIIG